MVTFIINGNKENVMTDSNGLLDLFDFSYIVDKYLGTEVKDYFDKSIFYLSNTINELEKQLREDKC